MVKVIVPFILILLLSSVSHPSIFLISNKLELDEKGNIRAEGSAEAYYQGYTLKADRILYIKDQKKILAFGNVYVKDPEGKLEAYGSKAEFDTDTGQGYIKDISGKYRQFHFNVKHFSKVEEEVYEAKEGELTTCPPEKREAVLCFSRARVTEKYVFAYNNVLKIGKLPVFYIPLWIFPVGERRSGLLEPIIGTDTYNKIIYRQPMYWAISRDKDITLTFDYRSEQANGIDIEYRQVFSSYSKLDLNFLYYREPSPPGFWWKGRNMKEYREDRYRFKLDGYYRNLQFGFDTVSDSYLLEDIYFTREKETVPYLTSYIDYHKDFKDALFIFSIKKFYDLTDSQGVKTIDKLPEVGFYLKNKQLNRWLYFSSEMYYTNFFQEEGVKSHRVLFKPKLSTAIQIGKLTNYISLTQINNYYLPYSNKVEGSDLLISTYEFENRLPLFWYKEWGTLSKTTLFEIVYAYQPNNYNNPQFDAFDEINKKSEIKFRVSSDSQMGNETIFSLFAEGGYNYLGSYFLPTDGKLIEKKLLPLRIALLLFPYKYISYSQDMYYDFNLNNIVRITNNLSLKYKIFSTGVGYYISRNSQNKTISDQMRLNFGINYKGYFVNTFTNIDNKSERDLFKKITIGYSSPCWALSLKYRSTWDGNKRDYINEIYIYFSIFKLKDFILPLRTR